MHAFVPFASLPRFFARLVAAAATLIAAAAFAATPHFSLLIDADDDASTGCAIVTAAGTANGIELVATTVVTTSTSGATVTRLERQSCAGATLGAPVVYDNGGWAVGLGNGTGGSAVVEASIARSLLPASGTMRVVAVADDGGSARDATGAFTVALIPLAVAQPVVPVPLSPWLVPPLALLLLACAWWWHRRHPGQLAIVVLVTVLASAGLAWAATVIRDGSIGDWAGVAPAVTDATGDAPPNVDIVAVFQQQDAANLYVRFDADIRRDPVANQAPVVSAGTALTITLPAAASLSGTASDDGLPNPPGALTLAWSKVSGPGTVTFANPSAVATAASFSAAGIYVLRLTASDGALSSSADVTVTVNPQGAANLPPTVSAGPNQTITLPASAVLAGSATDDGLPNPPGALTLAWSKVSGPGNVTFASPASAATSASFGAAGAYVLRLTANDGALSASADVTITVNAGGGGVNLPPTVSAGAPQTITLPAAATLAGSATDDGLPNPPGAMVVQWSVVSGPSIGVVFANPGAAATSATFPVPGTYVLQLAASDGALTSSASVQVVVNDGAPQLLAVPDRSITLGARFQQVLQAIEGNVNDTLTYALVSAPGGATLNPAPLIDWTPTAAQVGVNTFTASVTDAGGRTATTTFRVTVIAVNRAPQLAPQPAASLPAGIAFARTLTATDPDGDPLTFALVSGPAGMTLAGDALSWATASSGPGDYAVTVRVTDSGGLSDTQTFVVTLLAAVAPTARDDSYAVQLGQTLAVPAAGMLGNDLAPFGRPLSAQKLTDPDKGTLSAFGADGSFTYQAPATSALPAFALAEAWRNDAAGQWVNTFPVIGDVNGDGAPDYVLSSQFIGHRAVDGRTGATLWDVDPTGWTDCRFDFPTTTAPLLADVDDDGTLEYVGNLASCERDSRTTVPGYAPADRIIALDARTGRVKWGTQISAVMGDVLAPGTPPSTEPRYQHVIDGAAYASMAVARFSANESSTILFRRTVGYQEGYYQPVSGPARSAGCRGLTGRAVDDGVSCRATVLMNADGSVREMLVAPNPTNIYETTRDPWRQIGPFAVDLDGDGIPEIVSGSDVWRRVGGAWTLAWQSEYEPIQALAADLDGDGRAEIVQLHALDKSGAGSGSAANPASPMYRFNGLVVLDGATGAELYRIRLPLYWTAWLTIADADGDGTPDFVINSQGTVMVIGTDGRIKWTYAVPPGQIGLVEGARSGTANVQVYDLDGDGINEIVTNSHSGLLVLNGRTGAVKASAASAGMHGGYYSAHNVQIADFDDDGHADILAVNVSGTDRLRYVLYRGAPNDWLPGPKSHHQANYIDGDLSDTGRVLFNSRVPASFRNPAQRGSVGDPRKAAGTAFTYAANDGVASSAPASVFIALLPANRPPVITSTPPRALWQRFAPTPPGGLVTNYYDVAAYDPDPGDTLTYSLVSPPAWVTIDATTGRIRFEPTCGSYGNPCNWGWTYVVVRVTDSRGAWVEQAFMVNLTVYSATVPNVVGQPVAAAMTMLQAAGLQGVRHAEMHDARPAGTVLNQVASGGATVAAGDDVLLTLSKGPPPVIVPFLVGQDLAAARLALQGLGLGMIVVPQASTTVPRNQVMAQAPAGGTALVPSPSTAVSLTVSSGAAPTGTIASIVVEPGNPARLVGESLAMKATAVLADGTATDVTLNALWSSSAGAVASVDTTGSVRATSAGTTQVRASVGAVTGQTTLTVTAQAADVTAPTAAIATPADGADVLGPTPVAGTATDANFHRYELAIAPAGEATWTVIAEGTSPVTGGTLGTLDPAVLVNDQYTLRLTVFDRGGNASEATTTVQVRGNRKVGLFALAFTDLNVALTGVPITVTRTYDSRDKAKGDFGVGWRLGLNTLRVRTNRVLGTGWERVQSGPASSLQARGPHKVSLTLPDGRVEEFDLQLSPTSGIGVLTSTRVTGFAPRPGTQGKLEGLDNPDLLVVNAGFEDVLVDDGTLEPYDPKRFRYTTLDGTRIEIHRTEGVKKITDRNGNAITFGPDGILHSAGPSVTFTRDAQGRITSIRDLNGNVQAYGYDGNGDLVSHTDPTGAVSRYAYNRHHGLIDMRNALGTRVTRNDYDATGRLVSMTDADGKQITFTHNEAANEDVVTDRRGNVTRLVYDASGNVTRQERPVTIDGVLVNAVTTSTYDALGNETSTVDPDGRRTDATFAGTLPLVTRVDPTGLNLTTTFAYNARNDVIALTDAGGRTYAFTVDAAGNLSAATMPGFGTSTASINAQGLPTERGDALGNRTVLAYDAAGRVVREETYTGATLLRRVDATWDANGNRTSETLLRTIAGTATPVTTRFSYDASNRLVGVIDAAGGIRRFEYDPAGHVTAEVDPLGRRTVHAYDTLGRRTRTTYPDGTAGAWTYDAEGNLLTATDRAGRATTFVYDEIGRRTKTIAPDGGVTQTVYSAGGRVAATIDARGHRTDYSHDAAGRAVAIQLPAVPNGPGGPPARPQYNQSLNALGLPVSRTDPLGRVTTFQFDSQGRVARSTHPDGSYVQQVWDDLGRLVSVTNEEGQATSYSYDALGRLVGVAGYAGTMTYAYDEAGNLVSQTDAAGRVTRFRHDLLNRLVERTYPGGETERWAYDAVGNVVSRTDGLGRVSAWTYDALNRPVTKTLPGGATIATTYRADGQRASVADARGVTTFGYDAAGRLASVTHPTGETVTSTYDASGNLATLVTPAAPVAYDYDALDRLIQISAPEGTTTMAYDLAGNRLRRASASGLVTDATFDARNRPATLAHRSGATTLLSYATTWSAANRRLGVTEHDGSVESYAYDARGRLTMETRTGTGPHAITHAYDPVGNRLQTVRNGQPTAFAYDVNDRLVSAGGATFVWDANGNLLQRAQGGNSTQFAYDPMNRLISVTSPGAANHYSYDADGRRIASTTVSGTSRLLVDDRNGTGYTQVLEERDGGGALAARYTYGSELLTMQRDGTARTLLTDPASSVRALADATGAITDQYRYDAYGTLVSTSGATVNPYGWRGHRRDDVGLIDMRARLYYPELGRFMVRDPHDGSTSAPTSRHRYLYANSDPVNNIDPTGTTTLTELGFAQALNSMLDASYLASIAGEACTAKTGAESLAAFASGVGETLRLGFLLAQGMVIANEALNPHKPGHGGSFDFNYKSADGGWLPINVGLRSKAGQYAGYFSIKYQDPRLKTGNIPYGKFEFTLAGPPAALNVSGGGGMERTLHEFRYCGKGGPKVGSIKVKGEGMGTGTLPANGGSPSGALGFTASLEMSLFYDALKFSWPLVYFTEGTKGMKLTMFGLWDLMDIPAPPQ